MNHRERFVRTLTGQPVDRVPFIKVFGGTNAVLPHWEKERPGISMEIDRLLGFEGTCRGWAEPGVNMDLSRVGKPSVIEDSETKQVLRYADGTVLIALKGGDYHRHTIEWPVKNSRDWERVRDRHLQPDDPDRFPADWLKRAARFRFATFRSS